MKRMTLVVVAVLSTMLMAGTSGSMASAETRAAPFYVSVSTANGGPRIKVAKVLRVKVKCPANCRVKARFKLITPVGSDTVKGGRSLEAGSIWQTGMILTDTGRNVLKKYYRGSRLAVRIIATDSATGKTVTRNKSYRFYK